MPFPQTPPAAALAVPFLPWATPGGVRQAAGFVKTHTCDVPSQTPVSVLQGHNAKERKEL